MKFGITKDFGSARADVTGTNNTLELKRMDTDEFVVLIYTKDSPYELGIYTKKELETLWKILSVKK